MHCSNESIQSFEVDGKVFSLIYSFLIVLTFRYHKRHQPRSSGKKRGSSNPKKERRVVFIESFQMSIIITRTLLVLRCRYAEVGNVTSKCNGVTPYRLSHALREIIIKSHNVSHEPTARTIGSDNDFHMPRAITIKSDNFSPQC
jgi:hypothetical protein